MKRFRRIAAVIVCAAVAALACRREKPIAVSDSTSARPAPASDTTAARTPSTWDPSAGALLLVATDSPTKALVVLPTESDTTPIATIPHPASVTLFGRGGNVQTADLTSVRDTLGCLVAPLTAAPPPHPWNVGFVGGVITPLAVDSAASVDHADSAVFVAWLTRLASALPNDPAGRFSGLPFVVQSLWRFSVPDGPTVVVGSLVRQINQEATPLQERTFIVGERRGADTTFTMGYAERSYGQEETVESRELIAALLAGDTKTPTLVLARDYGDDNAYSLVERGADGRWRNRWTSRRRHC
ncbi:MAG TPA: hypothetical protein VGQ44_03085 [Gemmatimonadaceae bacterium]|jgi:hypothetical protein|nr:hypothetical protein [Gemmatimonadaceae bacterium]